MTSRRDFVQTVGLALPVLGRRAATPSATPRAGLDAEQVRALAEAILPEELGPDGVARAAAGFGAWLDGFAPGAEASHGYGTAVLGQLPEDPRPRFLAQLDELDAHARRRWGSGFAGGSAAQRRELVESRLAEERPASPLPSAIEARHVSVALLAWFYATPEATDLCYRAAIGRETCRPLEAGTREPPRRGGGPGR